MRAAKVAETVDRQRLVEEVGPKGDDDANPALGIERGGPKTREQVEALSILCYHGEDLLELVHDDDELGIRIWRTDWPSERGRGRRS